MDNSEQHKLLLIASAKNEDGQYIHDLKLQFHKTYPSINSGRSLSLLKECIGPKHFYEDFPDDSDTWDHPYRQCYVPNDDPMALIAAGYKQGWQMTFHKPGRVLLKAGGVVCFQIKSHVADGGLEWSDTLVGKGTTDKEALIDVLFKATLSLKPSNWKICNHCGNSANTIGYICPKLTGNCTCVYACYLCHGAGFTPSGEKRN